MTNNVNFVVQIVIDVSMQTMLTRIQQMINVNFVQKSFEFSSSSKFVNIDDVDEIAINNEQRFVVVRIIDNIEYFDFIYENKKNSLIVNVSRHIYYQNIFIFVDELKNLKKISLTREYASSLLFVCETKLQYDI